MNDQLKKYVEANREGFDHLEPSEAIFFRIKDELKASPKKKKPLIQLLINHKWMAAASILIIMSITYLLFTNTAKDQSAGHLQLAGKKQPQAVIEEKIAKGKVASSALKNEQHTTNNFEVAISPIKKNERARKSAHQPTDMVAIYRNLTDSSSASNRLTAVLKIQETKIINNQIIDELTKTLNHDSNSNVRLAVLELLSKYAQDNYVVKAFVKSLISQKDPLVQVELINLLARTNDAKLDEKLYALANDPTTAGMVKDQAYQVLLNQSKL
ncbi:HEAT repeat domain-containing protein [Pedobacter sp. Hv1]|uniref:HEAT repeat domain-containing protein n=1 Tax=Pedobacter sp. Hv1 TaxID=1740090 RepID=UPI0006D89800|nr:HEAT repeat domain-containing protein [Pedobacter sp. Hv1]KQC00877.1 hypothetical protein AQF98_09380 [Pedobacter sp. Hv1]